MSYFKLPSGLRDILSQESARLDQTEEILRKKFKDAGFSSVRTAGIEYYDTFACIKSSVPQTKMFKMTDKDGNLIVLRPDMTLACARIAATKLRENSAKLCYFSNVYDFRQSETVTVKSYRQAWKFSGKTVRNRTRRRWRLPSIV